MSATRRAAICTAVLLGLLTVSGCSAVELPSAAQATPVESIPVQPIAVVTGSITSVVSVPVTAVVRPEYAVVAPGDGRVRLASSLTKDKEVTAGQVLGWMGETTITAPTDGILTYRLPDRTTLVHQGIPVATIRYPGFGVTGTVPVAQAFRLSADPSIAKVQLDSGPGVTDCAPQPVAPAASSAPSTTTPSAASPSAAAPATPAPATVVGAPTAAAATLEVLCLLPSGTGVVDGLTGTLGLRTGEVTDVLVLPVAAVAGAVDHGDVALVVDGTVTTTPVTLGISDGVLVEITGGLALGDQVLPFGPNLRQTIS